MRASGMPVPEWMMRLGKEPTVMKQRARDRRKRGQPAKTDATRAPKRRKSAAAGKN